MHFSKQVKTIVGPLLTSLGFRDKIVSEDTIEFEYRDMLITASYDSQVSYEADFMFTFKSAKSSYSLNELKIVTGEAVNLQFATQITDESIMINWLEYVRSYLNVYLPLIIIDPLSYCKKLEETRSKLIENENKLRFESKVNQYWIQKDYKAIVKLVESYDGQLKELIKRKYDYSIKKL